MVWSCDMLFCPPKILSFADAQSMGLENKGNLAVVD